MRGCGPIEHKPFSTDQAFYLTAGDFETADNEMWAEQMHESPPQPPGPVRGSPGTFRLPTTAAAAHPPTYALAGGSSLGGGMPGSMYHTPQHQQPIYRAQPGPQTSADWTSSPPHSTKSSTWRTDQFHLPGGLDNTSGIGGGVRS